MEVSFTHSRSSSTTELRSGSREYLPLEDAYKRHTVTEYRQKAPIPGSRPRSYDVAVTLTLALHLLVLFVHCVLLVTWATSAEQRVVVSANDAAHISTIIDALLQGFVLILTTALIAAMAPLAIRTQFLKSQTLTALSDVSSSWNGLGISAVTLYHNIRLPAAIFPVILTTIYFLALTGLHVTTPLILTVPVVEITRPDTASTVTGTLDVRTLFPNSYPLPSNLSNITFDWYLSSASLSLLGQGGASDSGHIGLQGNRVFDTLVSPFLATNASAIVNYTDFNVKCGRLPQDPVISTNRTADNFGSTMSIELGGGSSLGTLLDTFPLVLTSSRSNDDTVATKLLAPSDVLVRIPHYIPTGASTVGGRNILLYSLYNAGGNGSSPIVDSSGSVGPSTTTTVYGAQFPNPHDGSDGLASATVNIQVIGCSLSTNNGNMTIDATTNSMYGPSQASNPRVRMWEDWEPDNTSSNNLADLWESMFAPSSSMALWREGRDDSVRLGTEWSCYGFSLDAMNASDVEAATQSCHIPTVVEQYLSDSLFGIPRTSDEWVWLNDSRPHTSFGNATLATLEDSLAKATAMMMSVAARERTLSTYAVIEFIQNEFRPQPQTGLATVQETVLKGRLTINITVLALGTGASIILLLIAIDILSPQIRAVESVQARTPLNGVSLLQIASLDTTSVTERLVGIDPNATEARRKAGLFNVTVVDGKLVPVGNSEDAREKEIETGGRNEDDRNALLDRH